jgi:hypothetical protein
MTGRLKDIDHEAIIEKGKPWRDKMFDHPGCLFKNGKSPIKPSRIKDKWMKYHWKRASEYFGEDNY